MDMAMHDIKNSNPLPQVALSSFSETTWNKIEEEKIKKGKIKKETFLKNFDKLTVSSERDKESGNLRSSWIP